MILDNTKLVSVVTLIKDNTSVVSLIFLQKNFDILDWNNLSCIIFIESSSAGDK